MKLYLVISSIKISKPGPMPLTRMKGLLSIVFLFFLLQPLQSMQLVKSGSSDYVIVRPEKATEHDLKSATELQYYLEAITGARLEIISDREQVRNKEIILGHSNRHIEKVGAKVKYKKIAADGFHILTHDGHLIITGGERKGTLYGVYTLLETYLGCRMYVPGSVELTKRQDLELPEIDDLQNPVFEMSELYFPFGRDQEYADWHKFTSYKERTDQWGMWVHTFEKLIPTEDYFEDHPEYFAEIGGIRIPDGQLCLSNTDIPGLLSEALKKKIERKPDRQYWSVSQNDNYKACECDECSALVEEYEGESGPILYVVNQVAADFPEKTISTLAYQYSRATPTGIRPADNVNIMLCSIECDRSTPIENQDEGESFASDLEEWKKLTENILLWDYVVQFRNYISPFPNLRVLQPNIRYFSENNVALMFQQGSGTQQSEFHELRSYLIAKLLWDPDRDIEQLIDEFVYGFYGPAAPFIREYITIMHDALETSGDGLSIYGYPHDGIEGYLKPSLIENYTELFDKAEKSVENEWDYLERVVVARLPLEYAILDISLKNPTPELSYFMRQGDEWRVNREMLQRLEDFTALAESAGISQLLEGGKTPARFEEQVLNFVRLGMINELGLMRPVEMLTKPSENYSNGNGSVLTDGLRGLSDYNYNWLGFEGNDLEAIVDLGQARPVSYLSASFLQNTRARVFMPEEVIYEVSLDGADFERVATVKNDIEATRKGVWIMPFDAQPGGVQARYIKVRAVNIGSCPEWHTGAGEPAWIFTDEIVIE
jgi:hypothetical protein